MIPFAIKLFILALLLASSGGQRRRFSNKRSRLDLLKKIVQTTNEDGQEDSNNILERIGEKRPTSILDRVRNRPKLSHLEPLKSQNHRRPFSSPISHGSQRNGLSDNECEELKNENDILKQLVESVNKKRAEEAKVEISNIAINQEQLSQVTQPSPLSILSEALKLSLGLSPTPPLPKAIPGVHDRGIRRVLTIPEPSTIFQTTSYETHLTSHVTKDISLRFQGKWKTTHVLDTIIETSTITEVVTTVITATAPSPLPKQLNTLDHNQQKQKQMERPRSNGRFRPSTPKRSQQVKIKEFKPHRSQLSRPTSRSQNLDSFNTLKTYLKSFKQKQAGGPIESPSLHRPRKYTVDKSEDIQVIQRDSSTYSRRADLFGQKDLLKEKIVNNNRKLEKIPEAPSTTPMPPPERKPLPPPQKSHATSKSIGSEAPVAASTSIVTLYLSGKVPGVYSTSLKTVTLESESPAATREKRHAEGVIRPTKTLRLDQDAAESTSYWDLVIESSFEEAKQPECREHTVTVTVVETVGCHI